MVRADEVILVLREGPCTADEFDGYSPRNCRQMRADIGCFNLSGVSNTQAVFFLFEQYDEVEVLELWMEVNSELLSDVSKKSLYYSIAAKGDEWLEAVREVIGTEWHVPPNNPEKQGPFDCPFCEEEVGLLSSHLANEHNQSATDQ